MCTVIFGLKAHPAADVIVAANRDELRARPTAPFGRLEGDIFGGRDLQAGGTWFAARPDGAMALLTNVRPGTPPDRSKRSRGDIVLQILREKTPTFATDPTLYNPFNVLYGHGDEWFCQPEGVRLTPGWHVLGNIGLDAAEDPKTVTAHQMLLDAHTLDADGLRARLEDILKTPPIWLEAGIYGSRWSMMKLDDLRISERGIGFEPLTDATFGDR